MKTARGRAPRLRVVSDTSDTLDRVLAPLLVRLAALEKKVEVLERRVTVSDTPHFVTPERDETTLARLVAACRDQAIAVSADGWIREYGAARLLGRSAFTLRNWRYAEQPLPCRMLGGRIEYRLADLADFLDRTEAH